MNAMKLQHACYEYDYDNKNCLEIYNGYYLAQNQFIETKDLLRCLISMALATKYGPFSFLILDTCYHG